GVIYQSGPYLRKRPPHRPRQASRRNLVGSRGSLDHRRELALQAVYFCCERREVGESTNGMLLEQQSEGADEPATYLGYRRATAAVAVGLEPGTPEGVVEVVSTAA